MPPKHNCSELSNAAAMSPFRHITWPTSVSIHDKTLKGGKIHRYNDICEIANIRFLHLLLLLIPSTKYVHVFTLIFVSKGFLFPYTVPFTKRIFVRPLFNE